MIEIVITAVLAFAAGVVVGVVLLATVLVWISNMDWGLDRG